MLQLMVLVMWLIGRSMDPKDNPLWVNHRCLIFRGSLFMREFNSSGKWECWSEFILVNLILCTGKILKMYLCLTSLRSRFTGGALASMKSHIIALLWVRPYTIVTHLGNLMVMGLIVSWSGSGQLQHLIIKGKVHTSCIMDTRRRIMISLVWHV